MNAKELAERNVGENLDQLMNLDPRGYGVCRVLYPGARNYMDEPIAMKCAKDLKAVLNENDIVYIITGFVLLPHMHAEMDGIIGAMLLARMVAKAYGAKPVIICPDECSFAVEKLSNTVGLHLYDTAEELKKYPVSVGRVIFTKDNAQAKQQAENILAALPPKAVIAIEAPGANSRGVYHNAKGKDLTALEAKTDILFRKCQDKGIFNMAIGDLGNELGMGSITEHLTRYVPYMGENSCTCGCGGGSASAVAAKDIITATISHWGAEAVIAATAWLLEQPELIHSRELEADAIKTASACGMVDMYGWLDYCIDGVEKDFHVTLLEMMRLCVISNLKQFAKNEEWFDKVIEKHFFA